MSIDFLLLEDWSRLLQEDGSALLLESSYPEDDSRPTPRFQRGDPVVFRFATSGRADRPPVATATGPSGSVAWSAAVPMVRRDTPTYEARFQLPPGSPLGTYRVSMSYAVAGVSGTVEGRFDLVPGGDSGGGIISLFHYERPEARYCLAQLASGKLVQGKNPHL